MYKLAGFLRHLPGIDEEKARHHRIEVHGPMIAYLSAVESPGWQAVEEDGLNFVDDSTFCGASVNERVVKG